MKKQLLNLFKRQGLFLLLLTLLTGTNVSVSAQSCDPLVVYNNFEYAQLSPDPTCSWQTLYDFAPGGNCKWYFFLGTAGTTYTFKTGCGDGAYADFDTYLAIYNWPDGTFMASNEDACDDPRPYLSILTFTPSVTQWYFIKITDDWDYIGGNFALSYQATTNISASYNTTVNGNTVDFADASSGNITDWQWNFGDGGIDNVQNPSHTYTCPGTYTVSLVITDATGCSTQYQNSVTVSGALVSPSFTTSAAGNVISFTNTSSGTPTSYLWDFGDGSTGIAQSPVQTYTCSGSYIVTLTITDINGCTSSYTDGIYANGDPQASFSIASVNGTTVSLTDESTGQNLAWNWDFGDGNTDNTQNPSHTYACPGRYDIQLTVNSFGPCTSRIFSRSVTVVGSPTASFFSTSNGLNATFVNTSTGSGITNYEWDFGDGTNSTAPNPTHTYLCPGDYFVRLTAYTAGCSNQSFRNVTVTGDPQADFSFSATGTIVNFTDLSVSSTGLTYHWYFGDGGQDGSANPTHDYGCGGTYDVVLEISNVTGCSSYIYKRVVVVGDPNPGFIANILPNQTVSFSNTSTGTTTGFDWDFGDGTTSNQSAPTHVYDCPGVYYVFLTAYGNTCNVVTYQRVEISGSPVADYTYSVNGSTVTFTDASTGTGLTHYWDFADGASSTDPNPVHTFACGGRKPVWHTVTTASGCSSYIQKNVEVQSDPYADFTYSENGNTVDFTSTSVGNIASYVWNFYDENFGYLTYSLSANPSQTFTTCGAKYADLYITNGNGCTDYVLDSLSIPMTDVSASDTILSAAATGATYQWIDCNNGNAAISGETGQSFHVGTNGNYAVVVTVGACSDTSECLTVTTVGISNPLAEANVSVYPNPSNNLFNVLTQGVGEFTLTVSDLMGRTVFAKHFTSAGTQIQVIDLKDQADGVYTLRLQSEGRSTVSKKLIKQ